MNAPTTLPPEVIAQKPTVADMNLFDGGNPANLGEMFAALALAQGGFDPIVKNREVTVQPKDQSKRAYKFKYADLEEIRSKTTPHLSKNGFALLSLVTTHTTGGVHIRTILAHKTGARIESDMDVNRIGGEIKDFGATITYLRRYVVSALLGVAADDDLDEDGQEPGAGGGSSAAVGVAVHKGLKDAKTLGELGKIMAGLPKDEKAKYSAYYNQRQDELEAEQRDAGGKPAGGDDL
ncbi:ERF family protein (plasmid) [Burkholderia vietnamiensis]|uniref:ERF family protein n=1 Tax=Burkholderia vietnamiensis (strain G4 / LMG 22486) TaxID=269482 RepID=A4JWD4_BURVG|nr:ERF family protein [Burkholderia vietnamiensis G4]MCB4349762.1 ERF family protein [Burkholderia vietnamiensis]